MRRGLTANMVALPSRRRLGKSECFTCFSQVLVGKKKEKKKRKKIENQNRENCQVTESGCVISLHNHAKNANVDIYQCSEEDPFRVKYVC